MRHILFIILAITIATATSASSLCFSFSNTFINIEQKHSHKTKNEKEDKHCDSCPICDLGISPPAILKSANYSSNSYYDILEFFQLTPLTHYNNTNPKLGVHSTLLFVNNN